MLNRPFLPSARAALAALLLVSACRTATPPQNTSTEPVHVVLAATTDYHGWIEGHLETVKAAPELRFRSGGADVLGGHLQNLRATNPGRVVLFDSGDIFQGTLVSNIFEGEPVVEAYNELGYTAAAIGNHEFDYGPAGEGSVPRAPSDDRFGALKRNIERAKFAFLSANIFEKATGKRPFWAKPWITVDVAGAKLGVIGVTTTDTPWTTIPVNVEGLEFIDPAEAIARVLPEVQAAGAEAIVVLAHLGGACRSVSDPNDITPCVPTSEIFKMARALPTGAVDVIFSGHTHNQIRHYVNGIAISEAPPLGRAMSVVDLWVDRKNGNRTEIRPHVNICEKVFATTEMCNPRLLEPETPLQLVGRVYEEAAVRPDQKVLDRIRPYVTQVESKKRQPLGIRLAASFVGNYRGESALGNLLADTMRAAVPGADVAIMNSGGIRAELRGPEVTFGELFAVLPFDNYLTVLQLTGRELAETIRLGSTGPHGIMQVSGLKMTLDPTRDEERAPELRNRVVSLTLADGTPIDPERYYTVVMNDFLAAGGDGLGGVMKTIPAERITQTGELMRDVVERVLREKAKAGPLAPEVDGRIKVIPAN